MFGDDLILEKKPGNYLRYLIDFFEKYQPAIILGVQKVPWSEIDRYASIKYKKDKNCPFRAEAVLEKLPQNQAPSNVAQFGRFVVSSKIFAVLEKQGLSRAGELWFADAVNNLAQKDIVLAVPIVEGEWLTTGDPLRWLKANLKFALSREEYKKEIGEILRKKI
jgi:UTP--glucose-1-phosphate uridylyltransferase